MTNWGQMDVKKHAEWKARGHDLRVFHLGEDVTDRCRFADDTFIEAVDGRSVVGVAELFKLNAEGRKYNDPETHRVAVERVHGIEIREAVRA